MNHLSMTDDELATAVRDSVTSVHMTIPAEQIATRGRTIRTRRRVPLLTGALACAAGAVLAVTTMLSPGHQPGRPITAQLAAWTVTTQPNGDIRVAVHEMRDQAGLQRTLRADGLPVNVTFTFPSLDPSCEPYYPASMDGYKELLQLDKVVEFYPGLDDSGDWHVDEQSDVLLIHPSALPDGAGLAIAYHPKTKGFIPLATDLVKTSQECTGS